jgi:hypothetical protein
MYRQSPSAPRRRISLAEPPRRLVAQIITPVHAAPRLTNLFPKGVHDRPNPFDVEPKNSQQISSRVAACHLPLRAPPVWRFAFILDSLFCWRFFCRIAEKPGDRFALSNDFRQDPAIINLIPCRARAASPNSENSKANRIETMKGPAELGQICSGGRRKIAKKIAKNKRCYANTLRPRSRMLLKVMKGG